MLQEQQDEAVGPPASHRKLASLFGEKLTWDQIAWLVGSLIPVAVIYFTLQSGANLRVDPFGPVLQQWLGAEVAANPIRYVEPYRTATGLAYLITHPSDVKAIANGKVSEILTGTRDRVVKLELDEELTIAIYRGLDVIAVGEDQEITCGQVIGSIAAPKRASRHATILRVDVVRGGKPLPPPNVLPTLNASASKGEQLYEVMCTDCHHENDVLMLPNNRFAESGALADLAGVKEKICKGGPGMPSFESVLSEEDLQSVAEYVLGIEHP